MWGLELVVMGAMIGVNSIFAGYEIALASVSLPRLRRLAGEGRRGAQAALHMKQHMEASLAVVQLGITLVAAIGAAVGGAGAQEKLAPSLMGWFGLSETTADVVAIALVVLPLTLATIVVGELIPKVFALRQAERVCLTLSPAMRWFSRSVWPVVWLLETVVTSMVAWVEQRVGGRGVGPAVPAGLRDLRTSVALARAERLIGGRAEQIIVAATQLQSKRARDILVPPAHMRTLDVDAPLEDSLAAAEVDMHSRFPVVERHGDPQSIAGYVSFKDMVAAARRDPPLTSLRALVRPILSFGEDETTAVCLEQMMRGRAHIALVRDSEDTVLGMVTLEDVLEELVGEIEDEYDPPADHLLPSGASWLVDGGVSLTRIRETTGLDLADGRTTDGPATLGAWVRERLGPSVRRGDVLEEEGVRVEVRRTRGGQVQEAWIARSGAGSSPT